MKKKRKRKEKKNVFSTNWKMIINKLGTANESGFFDSSQECNSVFSAYGIDVNHRHLSLISDYMSSSGHIRAFNRMALTANGSPFQKMSFETSMNFYRDAVITRTCRSCIGEFTDCSEESQFVQLIDWSVDRSIDRLNDDSFDR